MTNRFSRKITVLCVARVNRSTTNVPVCFTTSPVRCSTWVRYGTHFGTTPERSRRSFLPSTSGATTSLTRTASFANTPTSTVSGNTTTSKAIERRRERRERLALVQPSPELRVEREQQAAEDRGEHERFEERRDHPQEQHQEQRGEKQREHPPHPALAARVVGRTESRSSPFVVCLRGRACCRACHRWCNSRAAARRRLR